MDVLAASGFNFVFGPLLDREKGGAFSIEGVDATEVRQDYVENLAILRTVFSGPSGVFEVCDFAPRFVLYDRYHKPPMLVEIIRPLAGQARARSCAADSVRVRPARPTTWAASVSSTTGFPAPCGSRRTCRSRTSRTSARSSSSATATSSSRGASRSRPGSRTRPSASSSARSTTGNAG